MAQCDVCGHNAWVVEHPCPEGKACPFYVCDHDYETVYEDMEKETLQCTKCGDRYSLYDEEMR